jgi:hypothetical protein
MRLNWRWLVALVSAMLAILAAGGIALWRTTGFN